MVDEFSTNLEWKEHYLKIWQAILFHICGCSPQRTFDWANSKGLLQKLEEGEAWIYHDPLAWWLTSAVLPQGLYEDVKQLGSMQHIFMHQDLEDALWSYGYSAEPSNADWHSIKQSVMQVIEKYSKMVENAKTSE